MEDKLKHLFKKDLEGYKNYLLKNKVKMSENSFHYNYSLYFIKKNNITFARYHSELAYLKKPMSINYNLKTKLGESKKKQFYEEHHNFPRMYSFFRNYPVSNYLNIFIAICLISILGLKKLYKNSKTKFKKSLLIIFSLTILSHSLIYIVDQTFSWAIVTENGKVYDGPSAIFTQTMVLPKGLKVITKKGSNERWLRIYTMDLKTGWIKRDQLISF